MKFAAILARDPVSPPLDFNSSKNIFQEYMISLESPRSWQGLNDAKFPGSKFEKSVMQRTKSTKSKR
jgi:hypothetical protein